MDRRPAAHGGGPGFAGPDLTAVKSALAAALRGDTPDSFKRAAVAAGCGALLPGDGAAVTLMSGDADRCTVYSSDHVLSDLAKREFTLGQGPSLSAFAARRPVLLRDMTAANVAARWPQLVQEIALLPIRALVTLPLHIGAIGVGVASIYRREARLFGQEEMEFTFAALDLLTVALLTVDAGSPTRELDAGWLDAGALARDQVHQATGMLIAQLGVDAVTAFTQLRREADALGLNIDDLADRVVNHHHRVTLTS